MRSAPSLTLEPRPSWIAPVLLALALVLAFISIWLSGLDSMLQWALSLLVGLLVLYRRLKPRPAPTRAVLQSDGLWMLDIAGEQIAATLETSALLAGLISLSWRIEGSGRQHAILLWPDALTPNTARQLRVWLRSGRAYAPSPL